MAERRIVIEPEVVSDEMAEILRRKTPTERLDMVFSMWRFARELVRGDVRRTHPDWQPAEVDRAVARRMSGGAV